MVEGTDALMIQRKPSVGDGGEEKLPSNRNESIFMGMNVVVILAF